MIPALITSISTPAMPDSDLRTRLYRGERISTPPTDASRALREDLVGRLLDALPEAQRDPSALPHITLEDDVFFSRIQSIRTQLRESPQPDMIRAVVQACGLDADRYSVDVVRLRAVPHNGHLVPEAAAAYYAHRDTWYGNPPAQINLWMPLFDVSHNQSFGFYPRFFDAHAENDSAEFDYDDFMRRAGWQNYDDGPRPTYPRALGELGPPETFALEAASVLLFSAAHLHATLPNTSGATRFSADFRVVHQDDHEAGRGAPNADNASTGSSFYDYRV